MKSVARNTAVMMGSQLVTWISGFVLLLFLPRYLGSEDYGRLYLAISITAMFEVLINFGGQYHITKETARNVGHAGELLSDSLTIRGMAWVFSIGAMAAFCHVAGYPTPVRDLILILGVAKLWEGAASVLRWSLQGLEQMQYPSIGAIVERSILTFFGVGLLLLGADSVAIAGVMAAGIVAKCLYLILSARRIVPEMPLPDWGRMKRLMRQATPYLVWSVAAVIYYRIDAVMLSLMLPGDAVGWYGAAYRIFDIMMFLPSIFTTALFPVISRLWKDGGSSFTATTRKSLEFIVAAGIPVSVLVFAFARDIIALFFGLPEYEGGVAILRIFSAGTLLVYVDFVLCTTILAEDRQWRWSAVAIAAILLDVILNFLLVPYCRDEYANGAAGAAIATVLTETFILAAAVVLLPERERWMPRAALLAKCSLAGAAMAAAIYWGGALIPAWPLTAFAALAVYVAALALQKPLDPDDAEVVGKLVTFRGMRQLLAHERKIRP